MPYKENFVQKHRDHHPQVSIGIFFIVLGVALLAATNDWFNLGGFYEYFSWETVLIFIGVILLLNLKFTGGLLFIAGGAWFLLDDYYGEIPEFIRTIYWPGVIVMIGIGFIISAIIKRIRE
jgi:hypothetical protein